MSKGLEALHHPRIELAKIDISAEGKHGIAYMPFYKTKQYAAIEQELKEKDELAQALSIVTCENGDLLKYKRALGILVKVFKEEINTNYLVLDYLTQEENDLLKEVLNNETNK